jgi:hypothetical protein
MQLKNRAFKPVIVESMIIDEHAFNVSQTILSGDTAEITLQDPYFCSFLNKHGSFFYLVIKWKDNYGNTGIINGSVGIP